MPIVALLAKPNNRAEKRLSPWHSRGMGLLSVDNGKIKPVLQCFEVFPFTETDSVVCALDFLDLVGEDSTSHKNYKIVQDRELCKGILCQRKIRSAEVLCPVFLIRKI
jgi:hypothetical protein